MNFSVVDWNGFDWLLAGLLILSIVRGFMRGLVRALFGLLGVLGGFQLATWNYIAAGAWLYRRQMINSVSTARIAAFLVIFVAVVIFFAAVGHGMKKTAHAVGLAPFDRALGGAFGFLRGVLVGVALIITLTTFAPESSWVRDSKLSSYFLAAAHTVSFVVPHDLR